MADAKTALRLLITGGGTGGHLFPAVAAAQALKQRQPQSEVLFVGTRRKIDTTSLEAYGFNSCSIRSHGLKGQSAGELVKALSILPVSVFQALRHLRRFRPQVALGVGGYVTGPVMLAAKLLGIPTVIHEQNSVPGMANRKLGTLVDRVCLSLPGSQTCFPADKVVFTGNPVRENILALAAGSRREADRPMTLLVLGGSQGAHAINRLVAEAFCDAGRDELAGISLIHQTGIQDENEMKECYRRAGVQARVAAFFHDMGEVYEQADFLVSRAGATTLTELAVLGKPAVLIPYPHAADNHQEKNAAHYVQGGGALQFREENLTGGELSRIIQKLAVNRELLNDMGRAMRQMAVPDAAEKIIDVCMEAAGISAHSGSGSTTSGG